MPADLPYWQLDPAVVCGLVVEMGERARAEGGLKDWERDAATWRAVQQALDDARAGARPATQTTEPPRWLGRLVRDRLTTLSQRTTWDGAFETIRSLERLGLVVLPPDDTYVLAAVSGVRNRFTPSEADTLREDDELRDKVVWRMFEVEGGGEISLANVDKYRAEQNSWQRAFLDLTADGTLPREQVLTAALAALGRDFSAYRAGWFQRLYVALAPTIDEDADRQPLVRALLGSGVSATVTFAVTRLKALSKSRRLDDAATVPALSPVLLSPVKGTAVAAVRLLSDIARRTPGLTTEVGEVAATGLGHPHADVQKAAADLLLRLGAQEVVRAAADDLAPTVRAAVVPDAAPPELREDDVFEPMPEPRTVPAAGPDDVVERLAALLENPADPLEVELVLAGVAGLDDPAVLQPLRKRARTVLDRGPHEMSHPGWLRGRLAAIVPAVLGEAVPTLESRRHTDAFLGGRLAEVVEAARAGARQPLLGTPDTAAGWLYPETLVRRLQEVRHVDGGRDVVAALLRLHPDGREEARRALDARPSLLPDELLRPVHYALGGEPPRDLGATPGAWWIAASRSRTPLAPDPWLASRNLTGAGRSAPLVTRLRFTSQTSRHESFYGRPETHTWWSWALDVDDGVRGTDETPTSASSRKGWEEFGGLDEMVGWLALTWPHDAEHFLVDGAPTVVEAAVQHEVRHDAVRVLDALLHHEGRMGPLAGAALAAGLSAGTADQRARAVDLALHLAAQGRLTGRQFGDALAGFAGPATPSRWARSLADLAGASRTGRHLVIEGLPTALSATDPQRRGLHELLEVLRGELLREQAPTPSFLVPWLSRFSGSSRAATAARALLLAR